MLHVYPFIKMMFLFSTHTVPLRVKYVCRTKQSVGVAGRGRANGRDPTARDKFAQILNIDWSMTHTHIQLSWNF
jgi:hypothetical protein